jgi:hypothetical protein
MSFTAALYEGDSVIHRELGVGANRTKRAGKAATALERAELATAEIKGWTFVFEAIWDGIKTVAMWLDEQSRRANYRRIDAYLSRATDHADLERRIRDLERQNQLNWIDCASR